MNLQAPEANPVARNKPLAEWNKLSKAQKETIAISHEILDFAKDNLADSKLRKDEIVYKTPAQIRRYKALTDQMNELSKIELAAWRAIHCSPGNAQLCL